MASSLEKQDLCVEYWKQFERYCKLKNASLYSSKSGVIKKPYRNSSAFKGINGVKLGPYLGRNYLRVQIWIEIEAHNRALNVETFNTLKKNQFRIEQSLLKLGIIPVWDANNASDTTRKVFCESLDFGLDMPISKWEKSFDWIVGVTEAMNSAFSPIIQECHVKNDRVAEFNVEDYMRVLLHVKQEATSSQWNTLLSHASAQDYVMCNEEISSIVDNIACEETSFDYLKLAVILADKLGVADLAKNFKSIGEVYPNSLNVPHWQLKMHPQLVHALWQLFEHEMLAHCSQVVDIDREFKVDHKLANVSETERSSLVQARIGQGAYRQSLMRYWKGSCSVTCCPITQVLIASHIKPWSESENNERLDPFNGLLLVATLDRLFDQGLISFTDNGDLICKDEIKDHLLQLGIESKARLRHVDERHKPYLKIHRERFGF